MWAARRCAFDRCVRAAGPRLCSAVALGGAVLCWGVPVGRSTQRIVPQALPPPADQSAVRCRAKHGVPFRLRLPRSHSRLRQLVTRVSRLHADCNSNALQQPTRARAPSIGVSAALPDGSPPPPHTSTPAAEKSRGCRLLAPRPPARAEPALPPQPVSARLWIKKRRFEPPGPSPAAVITHGAWAPGSHPDRRARMSGGRRGALALLLFAAVVGCLALGAAAKEGAESASE